MKKAIALILVMVMILSFSSVAFAASPTGGTVTTGGGTGPARKVTVAEPSTAGKAALETAMDEQLKGKLKEGQTAKIISSFSAKRAGKVEANASGVKKGDIVYVLFRAANGKIQLIKAKALDGKVSFVVPGAGDFSIVLVDGGTPTVPSTGDSNRMMKLVLAGVASLAVMTAAGIAIKRTNG